MIGGGGGTGRLISGSVVCFTRLAVLLAGRDGVMGQLGNCWRLGAEVLECLIIGMMTTFF